MGIILELIWTAVTQASATASRAQPYGPSALGSLSTSVPELCLLSSTANIHLPAPMRKVIEHCNSAL